MTESGLSKEEREWNRQLVAQLDKYSYLRDWSELAAWLAKLRHQLGEWRGPVTERTSLLRRLATSLNPSLPVALHDATLEIYELLFAHGVIGSEELPAASVGLFSFFALANAKSKCRIVEIFTKHLPTFGRDLQLLATGLAITLLPSLNEMHQTLLRDVNALLDILARPEFIGQEQLAQAVWVAVLRSPACRVAGLKFLASKLGRGAQEEEQEEEQDNFWNETSVLSKKVAQQQVDQLTGQKGAAEQRDLLRQYCPHLQTLVVNALALCVQDSNILAVKAGLDFLYKYLPLRSETISAEGRLRLSQSVVWLLGRRDTSVTRKINLWLFGKPDDQNRYSINAKQLQFLAQALKGFLSGQASLEPLKVVFNLLSEHDQLPKLLLAELAAPLIEFCQRQEQNPQVLKLMHRLLERLKDHLKLFGDSLSQGLLEAVNQARFEDARKLLLLWVFLATRLLKSEELSGLVRPFLRTLLESAVKTEWKDRELMKLCLKQTLELVEKQSGLLRGMSLNQQESELLQDHHGLYGVLVEKVAGREDQQGNFQQEIQLISKAILRSQDVFSEPHKDWTPQLLRNIALGSPQHFLAPIEVIGEAIERDCRLKSELLARSEQIGKGNWVRVCMGKLWGVLSLGHLQVRVLPLLLRFVKHFPGFFEKLLEAQFQMSSELAIIKFRLFWQAAPKQPQIMGSEQVEEVSKFGLFRMLQFLDSSNPLVKYHSHLWVSQTYPAYHRILNPILTILLQPSDCWYRTPQGQFVYAVAPDAPRLLRALRHLRSFVRLVPDNFGKFAFRPLTPQILPYYRIFRGEDPSQQGGSQAIYAGALLELVVRLTQAKCVGGDNWGVDLAACELLQVVVRNVRGADMANLLLHAHLKSLLRSLHFATVNGQQLLQIQLLNLLRLLLLESEVRTLAEGKVLKEAVGLGVLAGTLLEGVACAYPYIKQRFVQFLNDCLPLLVEYHPGCGQVVNRVLHTYLAKIAYANSKKVEASSLKDLQISQKNAEILILFEGVKQLLSHFLNLHLRPFEKEKNQHDTDSGLFSFYSWKSYIHLRLRPKLENPRAKRAAEQISRQLISQLPALIATMAACWTFSELKSFYRLSREGLECFDYEKFLVYNKALAIAQSRLQTEDSVESFIIGLLRVLLNAYPVQTMKAVVSCWSASQKDVETRLKILQLLIFSGLPGEHFLGLAGESLNAQRMARRKRGGGLQLEHSAEQDLLLLCQTFCHYNFQNSSLFQTHNLLSIWSGFCRFLRLFENPRNVLTLFAVLQLLDLFLTKNNPKEILRDERLRKQLPLLLAPHNDLILLCSGKLRMQPSTSHQLSTLLPFPSSVRQLQIISANDVRQLLPVYLAWQEISAIRVSEFCRLLALVIAKRISYNVLACLQNQSQIMLIRKVKEIVVGVLPLVDDKQGSGLLVEGGSDLVLSILEKKHVLVKQVKNQILQIFNKEQFFICSSRTLQSWARIIDLLIDNNKQHDIFLQYLEKVSLASSLFSSYTFQTKKKIKSFERICFILYAGKKDKYNEKANLLVDKIIEVIRTPDAPQPVLILIFFCIRVLILRSSPDKLAKLLAGLWQLLLFLLHAVFGQPAHKDRLHLHWAALKLIQMISLMQIAEFHPHQWAFFYDFVGVRFGTHVADGDSMKLGMHPLIRQFLPTEAKLVKQDVGAAQERRHLIIKEDKIDDIELLKTKALLLSSYLIASNGHRLQFQMREVEELIDSDFLNLDEFIFKVK